MSETNTIQSEDELQLAIACDTLVNQVFLRRQAHGTRGIAIAVTAAHRSAGVTHIAQMLKERLGNTVACVDAESLNDGRNLPLSQERKMAIVRRNRLTRRSDMLEELRQQFEYIIIDCPSLKDPQHLIALAPFVDGFLVVVEANRTQKRQIVYTERTILSSGGSVLGYVLNKRTYAIPAWVFKRLDAFGI